jgi:hypothetical protein
VSDDGGGGGAEGKAEEDEEEEELDDSESEYDSDGGKLSRAQRTVSSPTNPHDNTKSKSVCHSTIRNTQERIGKVNRAWE